jgi:uncharacterized protein YcnI
MVVLRTLIAAAALAAAGPALAHVNLRAPVTPAPAGSYQPLRFELGHGCGEAATTALRIQLPPGFTTARPQPKPGWTVEVERSGDAVGAITWRGRLPGDQYDEFVMLVKLPADAAGALLFPAVQTCGDVAVRWDEPPSPDGRRALHPAPNLSVSPPAAAARDAHSHQDHR